MKTDTQKAELTKIEGALAQALRMSPEQKTLIKNTVAINATDDELKLFCYDCFRRGVHPLDKMIHFVKRNVNVGTQDDPRFEQRATHQVGIDFLRSRAEASGKYEGQDPPEFKYEDGEEFPSQATVKVYKKGISRPFVGEAYWKEFYPGQKQGFMWRKMPKNQLAKCAEALAIRKAFPELFADLYIPEEMAQADRDPIDVTPKSDTVQSADQTTEDPTGHDEEPPFDVEPGDTEGPTEQPEEKPAPDPKPEPKPKEKPKPKTDQEIREDLYNELKAYCNGNAQQMVQVLREESYFKQGNKEYKMTKLETINSAKIGWIKTILAKLKARIKKESELKVPDDCSKDPEKCQHSAFWDNNVSSAVCTQMNDKPCPHRKK